MTTGRQRLSGPLDIARHRAVAAAVVALLLSAQVVSAVHFILIPHTIDPRTGKVVGCVASHEERSDSDHGSRPCSDGDDHDRSPAPTQECQVYACFHQAQIQISPVTTIQPVAVTPVRVPVVSDAGPILSQRLYMLSPSHSPPVIAIS
jgi:hypothetical protein